MADKKLLSIIRPGDGDHYLVRDFLDSFPDGSRTVYDSFMPDNTGRLFSFGYDGNFAANLRRSTRGNKKHFVIFHAPSTEDLDTRYFTSTPESALIEIPDRLEYKLNFRENDGWEEILGPCQSYTISYSGTIEEMVGKFMQDKSGNPKDVFAYGFRESSYIRDALTPRPKHGLPKRTKAAYISFGIETPDRKYTIACSGVHGPYVFEFQR
jgi:hypothetical protein